MCGRYTLTTDMKKVADRFGAPMLVDEWATCAPPSYNIAPTQAMIVLGDDDKRHMKQMRWGVPGSVSATPSRHSNRAEMIESLSNSLVHPPRASRSRCRQPIN